MIKNILRSETLAHLIIFAFALFVSRTLFQPGYFTTHDGDFHIARTFHLLYELSQGQFPVRFATQAAFGQSYPTFLFFYPLPYYLVAGFHTLGFPVVESWKLLLGLATIASGNIFYLWQRISFPRWASFVGAILFLLVPFRFLSLYVTGQVGATLSLAWIPLILLGFDTFVRKKTAISGSLIAVGVAGLITSHLLSVLIFFPFLLAYTSSVLLKHSWRAILPRLLMWFFLGLGISSFYLLPLVLQRNWVVLGTQQLINFTDHWLTIPQLIYSSWGFGYSGAENQDSLSFQLGISSISAITLAASLIFWKMIAKRRQRTMQELSLPLNLLATFLFSIWCMLPTSGIVWKLLFPLGHLQYPWRFLAVTSLLGAWFATWLLSQKLRLPYSIVLGVTLIGLATINVRNYAQTYTFVRYQDNDFLSWQGLMLGSTDISWELLPNGTTTAPIEPRLPYLRSIDSETTIPFTLTQNNSTHFNLELASKKTDTITLATFHYPAWRVLMNNEPTVTRISNDGLIELDVPQGNTTLDIKLEKSPTEVFSDLISLASIFSALTILFREIILSKRT